MKRFTTLLMAILLVFTLGTTALAATTATGSVLRLESIQGTVSITNSAGRSLTASTNLRLLNGYTISTSAASYAYISLDDTKAIKLDGLTTCTVRQQGSSLEILLETGNIFFNVTAPLSSSETMDVRTSTMVTGIRGTSGTIWSDGANQSGTRLHTGSASVTTINPADSAEGEVSATGDTLKTATITAGQEAVSTRNSDAGSTTLDILTTTADDYSGFELTAIVGEDGLFEEILANGNTPLTQEVMDEAAKRLEQEQAEQIAKEKAAAAAQTALVSSDDSSPTFTTTGSSSSSGGGSSVVTTATVTTYEELVTALSNANITTITITDDILLEADVTIPTGVTVIVSDTGSIDAAGYTITIEEGATLTNNGTITSNNETILSLPAGYGFVTSTEDELTYTLTGYYDYDAIIDGEEDWTALKTALTTYDAVTLSTAVIMDDAYTLLSGKTLTIASGGSIDQDLKQLSLSGTVELATDLTTTGTINFYTTGVLNTNGYTLTLDYSFNSYGTINTSTPIMVTDQGTFNINAGAVVSTGATAITVADGGTLKVTNIDTQNTTVSAQSTAIVTGDGALAFTYSEDNGTYTLTNYVTYDNQITEDEDWGDLVEALTSYDTVTVSANLDMTGDYELLSNKSIDMGAYTITTDGYDLTVTGDITGTGTVIAVSADDDFSFTGSITSDSAAVISVPDDHDFAVSGNETDGYTLTNYYQFDDEITSGEAWSDLDTALEVYDAVTVSTNLDMTGDYELLSGKSIDMGAYKITTNGYDLTVKGDITGTGTVIAVSAGDDFSFTGTISSTSETVVTTANSYTPIVTAVDDTYHLTDYKYFDNEIISGETWDDVVIAMAYYNDVTIKTDVSMSDSYTLASTKTLTIDTGVTFKVGAMQNVDRRLYVAGTLENNGTFTNDYSFTSSIIHIEGTGEFINTGTVSAPSTGVGTASVLNYGKITLNDGSISGYNGAVDNYGSFILNSGTVSNENANSNASSSVAAYAIDNGSSGTLTYNGTLGSDIFIQSKYSDSLINDSTHYYTTDTRSVDVDGTATTYHYLTGIVDDTIDSGDTWTDLTNALAYYSTVTVNTDLNMTGNYALAEGKTLNLGSNTLTTGNYTLTMNGGSITSSGVAVAITTGTLTMNSGSITTTGNTAITVASGGSFTYTGDTVQAGSSAIITGDGALPFTYEGSSSNSIYTLTVYPAYDNIIEGAETWTDLTTALNGYDTVTLNTAVTMPSDYQLAANKTLTIGSSGSISNGSYTFSVASTATLTINGSSADDYDDSTIGDVTNNGTVNMNSGYIFGSVTNNGTVNMTGGTICASSTAVTNNGEFSLSGGTAYSTNGTGFVNGATGTLNMSGGGINSWDKTTTYYAIDNSAGGTLNFTTALDTNPYADASPSVWANDAESVILDKEGLSNYSVSVTPPSEDDHFYFLESYEAIQYITTQEELESFFEDTSATASTTAVLANSIEVTLSIGVMDGKTLDMGNYTITISNGGSLTAQPSITSTINGNIIVDGGNLYTYSGTINGDVTVTSGSLGMSGGTINGTVTNSGTFTMSGGTISSGDSSPTFTNTSSGSFSMTGGTIENTGNAYVITNDATDGLTFNGDFGTESGKILIRTTALDANSLISDNTTTYTTDSYEADGTTYCYITGIATYDNAINGEETWADLVLALTTYDTVTVEKDLSTASGTCSLDSDNAIEIDENHTLTISSSTTFTMSSGTINGAVINEGNFYMYGGSIGSDTSSTAFTNTSSGSFTMTAGTIENRGTDGYALANENTSGITLTATNIDENTPADGTLRIRAKTGPSVISDASVNNTSGTSMTISVAQTDLYFYFLGYEYEFN